MWINGNGSEIEWIKRNPEGFEKESWTIRRLPCRTPCAGPDNSLNGAPHTTWSAMLYRQHCSQSHGHHSRGLSTPAHGSLARTAPNEGFQRLALLRIFKIQRTQRNLGNLQNSAVSAKSVISAGSVESAKLQNQ